MDWRAEAACGGVDAPERFDAPVHQRASRQLRRTAAQLIAQFCDRCPVKSDCLQDAIDTHASGIRGGRLIVLEHGSISAYNRHKKAGEPACDACLEAAAAYGRDRCHPIQPKEA